MAISLVIHPDGDITEVNLPAADESSLPVIRDALDTDRVDVVRLTSAVDMWIGDESLYTHPVNWPATMLARRYGWTQPYHGPALLCRADDDGNSVDLTELQAIGLLTALWDVANTESVPGA